MRIFPVDLSGLPYPWGAELLIPTRLAEPIPARVIQALQARGAPHAGRRARRV